MRGGNDELIRAARSHVSSHSDAVLVALLANFVKLLLLPLTLLRRLRAAPTDGYVALDVDGAVVDFLVPSPALFFLKRTSKPPVSIARVRALGRALAKDPRAKGVLVNLKMLIAGPAVQASLRDALAEIRASGKDVVVYLPNGATNATLYVASAARKIVVGPETMVAPLGFAAMGRYVRRALERLGIEPEVFAKGMYKSAGEMLIRDGMSEPQREQLSALLDARHEALTAALATGRGVDKETAARWIDEAPHRANVAKELGVIDEVAYEDELERAVIGQVDKKHRLRLVAADKYLAAREGVKWRPWRRRPVLGVVEVHGPIVGAPRFSVSKVAAEDKVIGALRVARANAAVKGVVLHIDSPGGSAVASDRIYHEVARLAETKPVVAYMSNVAASGGYYVAAGAHAIVAQPETVTGSIGVVSARLVFAPLLEKIGVFTDVVKRGARADMFSATRRLDDGEREVMDRELDAFYKTFLGVVAKGRNKKVEDIEPLAQGRVYSGAEAHAKGLVDLLGGFERALHETRTLLGAAGRDLEAVVIKPPRHVPDPPSLPVPAAAFLEQLGLGDALEAAQLCLGGNGDRVLAWGGAVETEALTTPYR